VGEKTILSSACHRRLEDDRGWGKFRKRLSGRDVMQTLVDLLGSDRIPLFEPPSYNEVIHFAYKIARRAVREGADVLKFEGDGVSWSKGGSILFSSTSQPSEIRWLISYAEAWRKILEVDQEISGYFEVIQNDPEKIVCRIINLGTSR
jgi:hypothetical protein